MIYRSLTDRPVRVTAAMVAREGLQRIAELQLPIPEHGPIKLLWWAQTAMKMVESLWLVADAHRRRKPRPRILRLRLEPRRVEKRSVLRLETWGSEAVKSLDIQGIAAALRVLVLAMNATNITDEWLEDRAVMVAGAWESAHG